MTATIAECRENAGQCKWYASKTKHAEERKFLLRMTRSWGELAAQKEREVLSAARSAV
jgi:hypothetical protein